MNETICNSIAAIIIIGILIVRWSIIQQEKRTFEMELELHREDSI